MLESSETPKQFFRSLWLSDVHLGTRSCKTESLLLLLEQTECEYLYIVGDLIDGWRLRREIYWPDAHSRVISILLDKASRGTKTIYIPGNHDDFMRSFDGSSIGDILVQNEAVHVTADKRRLLVIHGDTLEFESRFGRLHPLLGMWLYSQAIRLNSLLNEFKERLGMPRASLSTHLRTHIWPAARIIERFENTAALEAFSRGFDGIVCGHIHHAELRNISGTLYINDGDWVDTCSYAVETGTGEIVLRRWPPTL